VQVHLNSYAAIAPVGNLFGKNSLCFFVKLKVNPNQSSLLTCISTADPFFLAQGTVTNQTSNGLTKKLMQTDVHWLTEQGK